MRRQETRRDRNSLRARAFFITRCGELSAPLAEVAAPHGREEAPGIPTCRARTKERGRVADARVGVAHENKGIVNAGVVALVYLGVAIFVLVACALSRVCVCLSSFPRPRPPRIPAPDRCFFARQESTTFEVHRCACGRRRRAYQVSRTSIRRIVLSGGSRLRLPAVWLRPLSMGQRRLPRRLSVWRWLPRLLPMQRGRLPRLVPVLLRPVLLRPVRASLRIASLLLRILRLRCPGRLLRCASPPQLRILPRRLRAVLLCPLRLRLQLQASSKCLVISRPILPVFLPFPASWPG